MKNQLILLELLAISLIAFYGVSQAQTEIQTLDNQQVQTKQKCPSQNFMSRQKFQEIYDLLRNTYDSQKTYNLFVQKISKEKTVLSPNQIVKLLGLLRYSNYITSALEYFTPHFPLMRCQDSRIIVNQLRYSNIQKQYLEVLKNYITDSDEKEAFDRCMGQMDPQAIKLVSEQYSNPTKPSYCEFASEVTSCIKPEYRSEESFNTLFQHMNKQYSEQIYQNLSDHIDEDPLPFSQEQLIKLMQRLRYSNIQIDALDMIRPYFSIVKFEDIIPLMNQLRYSEIQMLYLDAMSNYITDAHDEDIQPIVKKVYRYSNIIDRAQYILRTAKPLNCLFGKIKEKVATFVIDISGSMSAKFTDIEGNKYSRLEFVKQELSNIISQELKDYQRFNVIAFSSKSKAWSSTNVPVNQENISSSLKFINSLKPQGSTNISDALLTAIKDNQDLEAVYLLTDGAPTVGIKKSTQLIEFAQKIIGQVQNDVKIHTVSFMKGGVENKSSRNEAQKILEELADSTNATYRQFE